MLTEVGRRGLFYGWVVIGAVFMVTFFSAGTRYSFAAFYDTLLGEFGWSRSALAGAASLNLVLAGLSRPMLGAFVDRWGSKPVMLLGLGAAAVALVLLSFSSHLWQFYLLLSLMSVGYGAASSSTTVPLVSRWFVRRRATAQSVASAGFPLGELLVVPIVTAVLIFADWRTAYRLLAGFVALVVIPLVVVLVREDPAEVGLHADGEPVTPGAPAPGLASEPAVTLAQAVRTPLFWQLGFGFFACGFTMAFASTHFMAFADDLAIEKMTASLAMGLVGGVSILGTIGLGYLGDRFSAKAMLSLAYLFRGLAYFVLWQTHGADVLFVGALVLGLSWGATVPLTAACVTTAYGRKALGSIFGTMFAVMPVGSGLGAFLAGVVFDVTGHYSPALLLDGALGLAAAAIVFLARSPEPLPEPARPATVR
ncbi:MAG: MFS transporter [Chloroflexi bacterium]|nr:MFS transporter [Chloroflexota bacterium]